MVHCHRNYTSLPILEEGKNILLSITQAIRNEYDMKHDFINIFKSHIFKRYLTYVAYYSYKLETVTARKITSNKP